MHEVAIMTDDGSYGGKGLVTDKLNELIAPDRGQLSAAGAEEESNVVPLDARSASRQ